jgi:hypothetical protein
LALNDFDEFLDPSGTVNVVRHTLAPGLDTLEGKRLGILRNDKTNASKFLMMVYEELHDRYGVRLVANVRKENHNQPALAHQIDEATREADFAITGIGD